MKKLDKNLDNQIIKALTVACEQAKDEVTGFSWLTHLVDYKKFPQSLRIICVFKNEQNLTLAYQNGETEVMRDFITRQLEDINIALPKPLQQVEFATEN